MFKLIKPGRSAGSSGQLVVRRAADGSFRVDEKSLNSAAGVKKQATAANSIADALRSGKLAKKR